MWKRHLQNATKLYSKGKFNGEETVFEIYTFQTKNKTKLKKKICIEMIVRWEKLRDELNFYLNHFYM